jgi:tRNA(fMet)-specific endonuclease VapC
MKLALDTNRYSDFRQGEEAVVELIRTAETIFLPLPVVAELRTGFLSGTRANENEQLLLRFLNSPRVEILYPDDQTTHHYARLGFQLRGQGTPIPINDVWIGALVVQHGLTLCTRDSHFRHLPQIPLV